MQEEISCQDASFIFDMYSMISQNNRLRWNSLRRQNCDGY
jgi:hypothetical protein